MGFYFDPVFEHHELKEDSPELEATIQAGNLQKTRAFHAYIALILVIFILLKVWRRLYVRNRSLRYDVRAVARSARFMRRWCIQKAFWPFTTRGHMLIIVGYLITNLFLCMLSQDKNLLVLQLARRTGWLSTLNFSLLILFSMKNTPIEKLTGYSYDRLNVFHRWIGGVAWVQGGVHLLAIALATSRLVPNQTHILIVTENIMGIVAFVAWTITIFAFPLLKKIAYEYFFVIHMVMFPAIAVTLYLHNVHCQIPVLVGVGLYGLDRLVRTNRLMWHNRNAHKLKATLQPTKDGSTLVTIPRGNVDWTPGSHAFLSIPRIRKFQSHPFSILSINDQPEQLGTRKNVQFLIKGKRGFTKSLHDEAIKTEDQIPRWSTKDVTAYVDGPYGGTCDFSAFDHVVLMAAGAGITYILPIALSLVRKGRVHTLDFVWSIRETSSIETIRDELLELSRNVKYDEEGTAVNLRLHITGDTSVPKIGTLQRIKSIVNNEQIVQHDYDLYGSHVDLPNLVAESPPETGYSKKYDYSRSPSIDEWSQSHRRVFSGEHPKETDIEDPEGKESPPMVHGDGMGRPLLTSAGSFPLVEMPQPRTPIRGIFVSDESQYQAIQDDSSNLRVSSPLPEAGLSPQPRSLSNAIRSPSHSPQLGDALSALHASSQAGRQMLKSPVPSPALTTKSAEMRLSQRDPLKRFHVKGRPNIRNLITDVTRNAQEYETIAVGACGVVKWTDEIRKVVAECIETRGPSISLFSEEFGW